METGVYVLTEDVNNTKQDKRSKRFEFLPVWKKGMVIVYNNGPKVPILRSPTRCGSIVLYESDKNNWGPLVARMIPARDNISTLMLSPDCETWIDSKMILAALLKGGKINIQDIKDTIAALTAMEEHELEELERTHRLELLKR